MKGSDYVLINLIAFIICFIVGVYGMILLIKSVKENKSSVLYLFLTIIQFVFSGLNLYLFLK